jgi:hypothetical protein
MDPDGSIQPGEPLDAVECSLGRGDVPPGYEDPLETGQPGGADDLVGVGLEPVRVEVAVAVDKRGQAGFPW